MEAPRFTGFEILETMPQGAMGTVYKARQISLDRIVALKMLPPNLAADSADLDQFLAEARLTANLKHPNIVQVYDFGKSEDGIYYFVMEFVSGYSVGEWIRRKQLLPEESSLLVAQSVAGALGYAWEKDRVIHCDIKTDNIMIDGDGTVKVADLGLAKSVRSVVDRAKIATGIVFGTPNYISPEQSRGDTELDFRTDVYSLGATLYHCMTGKLPFEGEPLLKVMDRQITGQIPDVQDVNPGISRESSCLIEKMMSKDREERQQDWRLVSEDISRVMDHEMPVGELPGDGRSTMRRSAERGKHPRVVVKAAPKAPAGSLAEYKDSTAFEDMERKFERRQKRIIARPEWWFAGAIGVAVLVLGILVLRSFLPTRGAETAAEPGVRTAGSGVSSGNIGEKKAEHEVQDRKLDAGERFDFAVKWAQAHPTQYDEAIRNFERIARETKGTKYSLMALDEVDKIRVARSEAVTAVMEKLGEQADAMGLRNQFSDAAQLYEQYEGAFAAETASARRLLVNEWREKEKGFREKQRLAENQWQALIQDVSEALVSGDPEAALARVRQVGKDSALATRGGELNGLETILSAAVQTDQRILDSFRAQKDEAITLMLPKGPEKLTIRDVRGDCIQAEKIMVVGEGHVGQPRTLRVSDLALAEKRLRLGSEDAPEVALMNGLLLVQEGDWGSAEASFARTGPQLSGSLVDRLRKRKKLQAEEDAKGALSWLLRGLQVDIPSEIPSKDMCLSAIRRKTFSDKDAQVLGKAVETYRGKYGDTEFGKEYEPVLARLEAVGLEHSRQPERVEYPQSQPAETMQKDGGASGPAVVRAALLKQNPGLTQENVLFKADSSGRIVGVVLCSPALKDIQPLALLRDLREVMCSAVNESDWRRRSLMLAGLTDISALKGLALQDLTLHHTEVKDISALAGMPLKRLNLSWTKVQDLQCLAGLSLTDLDISGSAVRDIRPLDGMPLERLNISGTDVDSILPLRGMRLSVLEAGASKIRYVTPLRGMPLQSLNINDTGVGDISVLKGMPLKRLSIARTPVRDISAVRGMPLGLLDIEGIGINSLSVLKGMSLQSLNAGGTRISDLSPLEGMPLRSLLIDDTGIKDISVLRSMPLKKLSIRSTKVRDLTQIQGMQLEYLSIRGTGVGDLSPLAGMPLRFLDLAGTDVKDLTPIQNLPIEDICLDYDPFRPGGKTYSQFTAVLRKMPKLKSVNGVSVFEYGWQRRR